MRLIDGGFFHAIFIVEKIVENCVKIVKKLILLVVLAFLFYSRVWWFFFDVTHAKASEDSLPTRDFRGAGTDYL
jgi:hypothetical protein